MKTYLQVVTTTEKRQDAEKIAKVLVEQRLVACVQIVGPISSTYWWKGNIETAQEWLCLMKTEKDLYDELEKAVKAIHPYETPELVGMPIVCGSRDYLKWLGDELKK